ncbi:hypothetical protein HanPI659440_Chr16g0630741 [Helianthus annuus]|nr:hypothetical protein HanPI659440_Chr16g0630741 [Helianthus annuus]
MVVDGGLISKLLGIRDEGLCFSDVEPTKTLHPSLKALRARYPPTSYIAPSLVSSEIQRDKYADMAHVWTDFAMLFLTTMVSSQQNGYVKDKVLKRLTADTRFEDYNWCGFIVDCLRKCKKKWRPWDPKCWWVGPLTILTLLYVDSTQQPTWNTGDGVRAIHLWTKELLTRRQDYEIVTGGFGRGEAKSLSDGTVEKDVDVERVNSCVLEKNGENTSKDPSCVDKWIDELVALRARIEKVLRDRLTEDPNNETHKMLKCKYIEVLDVLPCFPAKGLEAFEDGEMLKRATGSTSSPPPALTGILMFFLLTQTPCVFINLSLYN